MRRTVLGLVLGLCVGAVVSVQGATRLKIPSGTSLPATCAVAEVFFLTNGTVALHQCVATNTWRAVAPGGSDTQIQFNNAGSFGASADLTWDGTTVRLGPAEATLPAGLQNYTGTNSLKVVKVGDGPALGIETVGNGIGFYIATANASDGSTYGVESDPGMFADGVLGAGFVSAPYADGAITSGPAYGFYAYAPGEQNGATIPEAVQFYSNEMTGPNRYYEWYDAQGVYRIKSDNTFNGVYQAIASLYNPQFTKYTPGAADYERVVQQWNTNVLEYGIEAGGTGTARALRLLTPGGLLVSALTTTGAASGKKTVCVDTATGKLYASSTGTDCSN